MAFWRPSSDADLIHIQWPEALFEWKRPKTWQLAWLEDRLDRWSSTSAIVTTVHNYEPHTLEGCDGLYRMVYEKSDGIVHLGEASKNWFFDQYDFASEKQHTIIPHGNYTCFPDRVTSAEARSQLNLAPDDYVCLCFGAIRHHEERALLVEAFDYLSGWRKKMVIAGGAGGDVPLPSRRSLQYWRIKYDPRLLIHDEWIPDDEVQLYLRAADVVVIPRQGVLNSGNVVLGFTFGRPVVGPDEGVIGEVLREMGNPVHEPGNPKALAEALEKALSLQSELGEQNRGYALDRRDWGRVGSNHVEFYAQVLN